ncbi:hypothetical protein BC628DRAFT_549258 [Trametes gibbosa]|nr:hypothetical protein BC628DRAFT_549258 [Trametes gibbosa]
MHATTFVAVLLSIFSVNALPVLFQNGTPVSTADGTDATSLSLVVVNASSAASSLIPSSSSEPSPYASAASSLLKAMQSEISAVDPSGTIYTVFATTISARPAVEISSIGGPSGQVMFVPMTSAGDSGSESTVTTTSPTPTGTSNRANDAVTVPTSLPSERAALSSVLSELASAGLDQVTREIHAASKTAELTAYVTEVVGTPLVALSSISGPAITLAATSGGNAFATTFDGLSVTAIPGS